MKKKFMIAIFMIAVFFSCFRKIKAETEVVNVTEKSYIYTFDNKNYPKLGITTTPYPIDAYFLYESFDISGQKMITVDSIFTSDYIDIQYGIVLSNNDYYTYTIKPSEIDNFTEIISGKKITIPTNDYTYAVLAARLNVTVRANYLFKNTLTFEKFNITGYEESPVIIGTKAYDAYPDDLISEETILNNLHVISTTNDYNLSIYENEYKSSYTISGEHIVKVKAYNQDNIIFEDIIINVQKSLKPLINTSNAYTVVDIDNKRTLESIKESITVFDETDGDISNSLVFDTNYDYDNLECGTYYLSASVTNSLGNTSTTNITIYVIDITAPSISCNYFDIELGDELEMSQIIQMMDVTDCSQYTYEVLENNYKNNSFCVGQYIIKVKLKDSSGNEETYSITMNVKDTTPPILNITNITTTTNVLLTKEEIEKAISSNKINVNYTYNLDLYFNNSKIIGEYEISIIAIDEHNNKSEGVLVIIVKANPNPIFYYNNSIRVKDDGEISRDDLILFLKDINKNETQSTSILEVETTYFETPTVAGDYDVTLNIKDDETKLTKEYMLTVETNLITIEKKSKDSFISKIKNKFTIIWMVICKTLLFIIDFLF